MTVNPRLDQLLLDGEFDWNNLKHREMYLKAWVNSGSGAFLGYANDPVGRDKDDAAPDPGDDA